MNFYNENNPFCVEWLNGLKAEGFIPDGTIDGRSISEVQAADVLGFRQCHWFAGIAGWSEALRIAGHRDTEGIWTASLPCQPLSIAGKRGGEKDERHLWPEFYRLVSECKPWAIFGEQSGSPDGRQWIDGISLDLEELGFAVGASDLCSPCVAAPHIRQRIYWGAVRMAYTKHDAGRAEHVNESWRRGQAEADTAECSRSSGMVHSISQGLERHAGHVTFRDQSGRITQAEDGSVAETGAWSGAAVIHCLDGKSRSIESGSFPLASGIPRSLGHLQPDVRKLARDARRNRRGRIEGYGNSIVPQLGAMFITAFMQAIGVQND